MRKFMLRGFLSLLSLAPVLAVSGTPVLTRLASFTSTVGDNPGGLLRDAAGNLFGTTAAGGANNLGTVYEVAANTHTLTTLVTFNNANGAYPAPGLISDNAGNLYGGTAGSIGGTPGTVFEVSNDAAHTFSTLVTFSGSNGGGPGAALVADAAGNLYGTTNGIGTDYGTVFQLAANTHTLTTLAVFNKTNGANPASPLLFDAAGNLYGTTQLGGTSNGGTLFKVDATTHAVTTLANFVNATTGSHPLGNLTMDADGNLYGVAAFGGASNGGTVFEFSAGTQTLTGIWNFSTQATGSRPSTLLADAAGNLFGAARTGGATASGTLFEIDASSHDFSTLFTFNSTISGGGPSGLIADDAGNLYGTTATGGPGASGTVFELTGSGFVAPEPASLSLLALTCMALLGRRRQLLRGGGPNAAPLGTIEL